MSDAWHLAKIKRFEQVLAAPGITLLRVTARPPRRHGAPGDRPILLSDDGHIVNRFQALPSPRDPRGVLRAAYSVPTDFVTPETVFSLLLDDGAVLSLPAPIEGVGRRPLGHSPVTTEIPPAQSEILRASRAAPAPTDDAGDEPDVADEAGEPGSSGDPGPSPASPERRSDIMSRVIELSAALAVAERQAREQGEARAAAEAALDALRGESDARLEAVRAEARTQAGQGQAEAERAREVAEAELAAARRAEVAARDALAEASDRARAEVEAEFAQARAELEGRAEAATAAEREAREGERGARAEADRAAAALGAAERRVAGLELSLAEHGEQIGVLETERDEAVRAREALGREVTSLRSECARLERELHDALDSVRRMALERDEFGRQAAAFDQVAIKARERATEAEEAHSRSQSVLAELETWRGELERRLASMSGELGDARGRLAESDRRLAEMRGQLAEAEAQAELAQAQLHAMREGSGEGTTTVIETAELERMSSELTALRSADARARQELDEAGQSRLREVAAERDELAARLADVTLRLQRAEAASPAGPPVDEADGLDGPDGSAGPDGPGGPQVDAAPGAAGDAAPGAAGDATPADPAVAPPPPPGVPAGGGSRLMAEPDLSSRSASEQAEIAALSQRAEANAEATATREITQALLRSR